MKTVVTTRFKLGSAIQTVIHAAMDAAPIPRRLKHRIKACTGCNRRARALDRLTISAQKLANPK